MGTDCGSPLRSLREGVWNGTQWLRYHGTSPMGSVKHPMVAFLLASARILYLSVRYARPMRVDYRTGDAWLDSE